MCADFSGDVGGQKTLRSYWRNYFEKTDALIWVVDATDRLRIQDCRDELQGLLLEEVRDITQQADGWLLTSGTASCRGKPARICEQDRCRGMHDGSRDSLGMFQNKNSRTATCLHC
jgi:hypothetical protein